MNSRERVLTALHHQEPDCVPFDLGSTPVTGIHVTAYQNLRAALDLPPVEVQRSDIIQQLAHVDEDVLDKLCIDVRGLSTLHRQPEEESGPSWVYRDEWGITYHRPRPDGLYYNIAHMPLSGMMMTVEDIKNHQWPDMADPRWIVGLRQQAECYRQAGYVVILNDPFAGIFEMAQRIAGTQEILMMMATERAKARIIFNKLLELKLAFWEMALSSLGDVIDIVTYADDYGSQQSPIISPTMFRDQLKPLICEVFHRIKQLAPHTKQFFHSCGNIRPLIPDFIEIGADILNPVQPIPEVGMEPIMLKQEFGNDLVFWGAGMSSAGALARQTPQEIKDDVRRNIEVLAPDGGFVFTMVHNIEADAKSENIIAMREALQEYGVY